MAAGFCAEDAAGGEPQRIMTVQTVLKLLEVFAPRTLPSRESLS
jgi:hypothetical protein